MFWKSKGFEELKREWNGKLEDSGFKDAEKEIAGERVLRQTADYAYRRKETVEVVRECKLSYFTSISHHLSLEKDFADDLDRLIMERTAKGRTIREISDELKALIPIGRERTKHNRNTIRYVRRRYENKWGVKIWSQQDMQSRKAPTR